MRDVSLTLYIGPTYTGEIVWIILAPPHIVLAAVSCILFFTWNSMANWRGRSPGKNLSYFIFDTVVLILCKMVFLNICKRHWFYILPAGNGERAEKLVDQCLKHAQIMWLSDQLRRQVLLPLYSHSTALLRTFVMSAQRNIRRFTEHWEVPYWFFLTNRHSAVSPRFWRFSYSERS
jgi:hypothetical protein